MAGIISVTLLGCQKTSNQEFTGLFDGEVVPIQPNVGGRPNGGGSGSKITILETKEFSLGTSITYPGNLAYDGVRLMLMMPSSGASCFPGDVANFQYLGMDLSLQSISQSTYLGISSNGSCNGASFPSFGTVAGKSGMFVPSGAGSNGAIVIRDNATGAIGSSLPFDFTDYGCGSASDSRLATYCGGLFYGVCKTSDRYMRMFSFNSSGLMQSAVTTTLHETSFNKILALTCYEDSSLILVTKYSSKDAYNGFMKFDLSFSKVGEDLATSYDFPPALQEITGIATDGSYLYIQGEVDQSATVKHIMFGKANFGGLK